MDKNKKDMPVSDNVVISPDDVQRLIDQRVAYLVGKEKEETKRIKLEAKANDGKKRVETCAAKLAVMDKVISWARNIWKNPKSLLRHI